MAYAISYLWQEHIVLKDKQLEILQELYQGNDAFAMFPTGYICYQPLLFMSKLLVLLF